MKIILYFDGAAKGNPGPAAAAFVLKTEDGEIMSRGAKPLGVATNNQAEYSALILGLEKAVEIGAEEVEVRGDSELVIRQLRGQYRVKNPKLKPLFIQALKLSQKFKKCTFVHIRREENREADQLANSAVFSSETQTSKKVRGRPGL